MIEQYLSRRLLVIILLGVFLLLSIFYFHRYVEAVNKMDAVHNEFKRFLFLLENTKPPHWERFDEQKLQSFLKRIGAELKSSTKLSGKLILELGNVRADKLPKLLKFLENFGEIESFTAVDNTGLGNFFVKITVKLKFPD